jgi:hypothetical protein
MNYDKLQIMLNTTFANHNVMLVFGFSCNLKLYGYLERVQPKSWSQKKWLAINYRTRKSSGRAYVKIDVNMSTW